MKSRTRLYARLLTATLLAPAVGLAASGWTSPSPVAELMATGGNGFRFELEDAKNPSGCRNKTVFFRDYDLPGTEQMYDTLLAALTTGKRVRVYVTGTCDLNGYSNISSVSITP